MNILVAAEESAGIQTLRLLARPDSLKRHKVVAVLTSSRSEQSGAGVATVAQQLGFPVLPGASVKVPAFAEWVATHGVDVLLNVHALFLIHPAILQAVKFGAFNLHPGPLPRYAGLNAPNWAIFNGEPLHAVTLHWIAAGIDTGDIAYQAIFPISDTDTGLSVSARCVQKGIPLIEQLLDDLATAPHRVPRQPQDGRDRRLFTRNEVPWDGVVQWSQPAQAIDAFVRACHYHPFTSPWGIPQSVLAGQAIGIIATARTHQPCNVPPGLTGEITDRAIAVSTADEWLLVERCHLDGHVVPGNAVLRMLSGDPVGSTPS